MREKVCVITGVGAGTGTALVKRFASGGYKVAMIARNEERLSQLSSEIENTQGFVCDVTDTEQLTQTITAIKAEWGGVDILVHNAVGGAFGDFLTIKPEVLAHNFQVNALALLHLGQLLAPDMIEQGQGAMICTGNTSAYRGKANFAGFAPTKAAQRILAESMARTLGPKGVHVAYVAIDAVIDVPIMREYLADKPDEFFCSPIDIANECFHVAHQARSAWSFNVEIRPFGENW